MGHKMWAETKNHVKNEMCHTCYARSSLIVKPLLGIQVSQLCLQSFAVVYTVRIRLVCFLPLYGFMNSCSIYLYPADVGPEQEEECVR